jgi:hypothetical protein
MSGEARGVRLRQAVLVAAELEPVAGELQRLLGLEDPFRDPGVSAFGLENAVFAAGDRFIEVVAPTRADTAAGRYLERQGGDGGYMVMFDVRDLDGARARAASLGVRAVWEIELPDIRASHLHPADMGGAIVSIDRPEPPESWRWGGPDWTGRSGRGAPVELSGVTLAVSEPEAVAGRWAEILGVDVADGATLMLDGPPVRFAAPADGREGLVALDLRVDGEAGDRAGSTRVGGVELHVERAR